MTHVLLWSHSTNTMRVQTLDWLLSQAREAYLGNRPLDLLPVASGAEEQMRKAMDACRGTLAGRHAELMRQPMMVDLLAEPRPVPEWRQQATCARTGRPGVRS